MLGLLSGFQTGPLSNRAFREAPMYALRGEGAPSTVVLYDVLIPWASKGMQTQK